MRLSPSVFTFATLFELSLSIPSTSTNHLY
jgi:hypothetical protein